MSVMLVGSSFVTTLLVPVVSTQGEAAFAEGGEAYGRALAFLAHHYFGDGFGTLYDVSTIAILWFAGASAMAALINLVPRYLPRYGMAPEWTKATRPLVLIFTLVTLGVTWIFEADVEAQGGAYATGVLVLMSSASVAVMLLVWRSRRQRIIFSLITAIFLYTTIVNVFERPDGVKIATFFIVAVIVLSLVSRAMRSTELRIRKVVFDDAARRFVADAAASGHIRIVANRPDTGTVDEYRRKEREARDSHHIPRDQKILILEVRPGDASEFTDDVLDVTGATVGPYRVLRCESPAIPNAIAAVLLEIQKASDALPHVYFGWTEGNPVVYVLKFIVFGEGDTAPVTREVIRRIIVDPASRPRVHVG
jgi:hypothetical protein